MRDVCAPIFKDVFTVRADGGKLKIIRQSTHLLGFVLFFANRSLFKSCTLKILFCII